jgi:hypothetical protein
MNIKIYICIKIKATIIQIILQANASFGRWPIDSLKLYFFEVNSLSTFAWSQASNLTFIAS